MRVYLLLILPLLLSGLVHHFLVIKYNLLPWLTKPIDGGIVWKGKPLFGTSKTWRGFIMMTGLNGVFSAVMGEWWIGVVTAVGYCLGELPTSFIKRRWNIGPSQQGKGMTGAIFYVLEQCDSILGAVAAANLAIPLTASQNGILIISGTGLHILIDFGLYLFGYKRGLAKPEVIKILLGQKHSLRQE